MEHRKVIPFYMTYPIPMPNTLENNWMKDLNYLQQLYPSVVKQYQSKVVEVLNRMDYFGSRIYDAYPDKHMIYKLSDDIVTMILTAEYPEGNRTEETAEWLNNLIPVLVLGEIYRRRHSGQQESTLFN